MSKINETSEWNHWREAIAKAVEPETFSLPRVNLWRRDYDRAYAKADAAIAAFFVSLADMDETYSKSDFAVLMDTFFDAVPASAAFRLVKLANVKSARIADLQAQLAAKDAAHKVELAALQEQAALAAEAAQLPKNFMWSADNIEKFKFGGFKAASAIRALPIAHAVNGALGMVSGDRVVWRGKTGTAHHFFSDGDAIVRFDGEDDERVVKWNNLYPEKMPLPEANKELES